MNAAVRLTQGVERPASPADPPPIPPDAIAEHELSWSRSTAWDMFKKLEPLRRAWRHVDGTRFFDRHHPKVRKHLAREAGVADDAWNAAPIEQQRESMARCRFLELVEASVSKLAPRVGRKEAYRQAALNLGAQVLGYTVPLPTFYGWKRRYEKSGRKRSSLIDARTHGASDRRPFDARVWAHFLGIWLTLACRSIRDCWREAQAWAAKHNCDCPEYSAFARRVRKEWPEPKADFYRLGERKWRVKHAPKLVRDKRDLAGNHTWEIDHLRLDFWSRVGKKRVRLWCTLIVDRASNLIVGWAITTNPSSDSLALAIRRAVKAYGAPLEAVLDNGRDMQAGSFGNRRGWIDEEWAGGIFEQMGVTLHWCRPFTPWAKGQVEAMARTIHLCYDKRFKSYCGGHIDTKPAGIDRWCVEHLAELPTPEEVDKLFGEWAASFAERPSDAEGIKPLSPRQRFEQTRIAKRTLPDHVLNILLLKLTGPRAVTAKGIRHNGMYYTSGAGHLFLHQGKQLRIRVDPDDISYAWACDMKGKPLFVLRQNYVKGTSEDVRAGAKSRKAARRICEQAATARRPALDDTPAAILRAQVERYRAETAIHEPPQPPPAPRVAPIRTPATEALIEAADTVRREEKRDRARRAAAPAEIPAAGYTPDEMEFLAASFSEESDEVGEDFTMEDYVNSLHDELPARKAGA